jgi:hypothetical protein
MVGRLQSQRSKEQADSEGRPDETQPERDAGEWPPEDRHQLEDARQPV